MVRGCFFQDDPTVEVCSELRSGEIFMDSVPGGICHTFNINKTLMDSEYSYKPLKSRYSGQTAGATFLLDLETLYYPMAGMTEMEGIKVGGDNYKLQNDCSTVLEHMYKKK